MLNSGDYAQFYARLICASLFVDLEVGRGGTHTELVKPSFMCASNLFFLSRPVNNSRHLPRTIQCVHLENYKFMVSMFLLLG